MHISKVLVITISVLIMGVPSFCSAKLIYDITGRISFETSDAWFYAPGEDDSVTYYLHGVQLDKDTGIGFKQSKFYVKYPSIHTIPIEEKSILRDSVLKYNIEVLKSKGYSVTINKTDWSEDAIFAGFTARNNTSSYCVIVVYFIKDNIGYSLFAIGTDKTKYELLDVIHTLKIDGITLSQWISG